MLRKALSAAGGAFVLLHVWIFASQAWRGEFTDLGLGGRWLLAAGLVWALAVLRRRGVSRVWSREAIAVWTLAALLHGPALVDRTGAPGRLPAPATAVVLLQTTLGAILIGLAGLGLIGLPRRQPLTVRHGVVHSAPIRSASAGVVPVFAARPPPRA